ncbi:MAG: cytochrome [Phenylobacterium sp.]|nr:cytochrome [Phenylobacterium sp.]
MSGAQKCLAGRRGAPKLGIRAAGRRAWAARRPQLAEEELFARLDSVELDGEPKRMTASFFRGPKAVPIRFKMR